MMAGDNGIDKSLVAPACRGVVVLVDALFDGVAHEETYGKEGSVPAYFAAERW